MSMMTEAPKLRSDAADRLVGGFRRKERLS